ncbi:hypothetical protein M3Y94_00884600 [Aphelenchoides besseyi]|nr:hypothetical protein M3Y94_00884600 [Aphelenchoides besseyi]
MSNLLSTCKSSVELRLRRDHKAQLNSTCRDQFGDTIIMAVIVILLLFLSIVLIAAWNHTRYWKRRGVKGPPLLPFLGILDRFDRPEYPNVFVRRDWTKIYGPVYGIQKGWKNALVISDPALIHEMITEKFSVFHEHERIVQRGDPDKRSLTNLFSARGKRWKRLRTLSNPVFSVQNLKKILPTLEDSALETVRLLEKSSANGKELDIHKFFHEYTMDTIARIAMGQQDSQQFKNDYTQILIDTFAAGNKWLNRLAWGFPALGPSVGRLNLLLGYWRQKGFAMLLQKTTKAVRERKAARAAGEIGEDSTDFIDFFLNAESDTVEYEVTGVYDKSNVHVNKRLTTDEVIAQCNVFLLFRYHGEHTLAYSFSSRQKSRHTRTFSVSYDDLNKMKYCEAVMKEVLRLHPIGTFAFARTAAETTTLGSVEVEKDTLIYVDVFSVHYDKKIWGEDADRFVPDRWFADHVPTAYYPFGGGPRVCIGMRLAYIEEKLALVHILRRFKIVECAATGDEPDLRSNAVLNPTHITVKIGYWHTGYWQRRGIDGPPSRLFFGILYKFGFPEYPNVFVLRDWTRKYGRVYGIQKGWKNVLVISDPEMVHEMMTEKFNRVPIRGNPDHEKMVHVFGARGKRWKRLRTLSNPVFSVQNLKKILPVLEDSARETTRLLEEASDDGRKELNIHPFSHEFTMDTIARIAMGQIDSQQFKNDYTQILIDTLNGRTKWIMNLSWAIPPAGPIFAKLNLLLSQVKQRGPAMLLKKVSKAVQERKAARAAGEIGEDSTDFIDFFLNAESNEVEQEVTGVYDKSNVHVSKRLTTQEIIASCNVFLIAGFDTTANTLSLSAFYLAKNPKVQERLFEEIETCCPNADVSYEDLGKMKYCEAVMKEVLRLHPIAAIALGRTAAETTTLGSVEVEKGTIVLVDVFSLQYDKKIWGEDADRFVPDRWFADHVPTAYYPFGGGPRMCIGMRLAYIEEKLALVHILRRFKIVECAATGDKPNLIGNAVLNPDHVTVFRISWYHAGYYRRRGIPGPKSKPLIGALDQLGGPEKPNVLLLAEWTRKYGRVYGFQKGWRNHLVISEPKMMSEMMNEKFAYFHEREVGFFEIVILNCFLQTIPIRGNVDTVPMIHIFHARGKRWARLRNLSTTIFSPQYLKKILPSLTQSADQIVSLLEKENGKPEINIHPFFFEFTIDTICGIVLGNSARRAPFTNPYSRIIFDLLNEVNLWIVDLSWMFPYFALLFSRLRMLYGMIKKSGLNELNTRVMKASATIQPELTPGAFDGPRTAPKKEMTIFECAANATAMMIAGFGTSSSTLALLCFYLAKHPEVQEKLREEFESVCVEENPTYEELHSLPYADAVLKECLRLHPVGTFAFGRRCAKTTTLGSVEVERGTHVLLDVVSMQRDPEIWGENASSFVPDRWFESDVPTHAYYPFGGGPRICPGRRLACLEIKLALLRVLQKFKVYEGVNMESEPKLVGNLILFPEQINVRLESLSA